MNWNIDGTVVPDVKPQDVVTVWGDVSEILNEVLAVDTAYRRVGKATIDLQGPYIEARLDPAMDECCEIYDRRRAVYSVSLSPIGTLAYFRGEAAEPSSEFRMNRRSTMVFLQNFEVHVINYLTRKHEVKTAAFLKYGSNELNDGARRNIN